MTTKKCAAQKPHRKVQTATALKQITQYYRLNYPRPRAFFEMSEIIDQFFHKLRHAQLFIIFRQMLLLIFLLTNTIYGINAR